MLVKTPQTLLEIRSTNHSGKVRFNVFYSRYALDMSLQIPPDTRKKAAPIISFIKSNKAWNQEFEIENLDNGFFVLKIDDKCVTAAGGVIVASPCVKDNPLQQFKFAKQRTVNHPYLANERIVKGSMFEVGEYDDLEAQYIDLRDELTDQDLATFNKRLLNKYAEHSKTSLFDVGDGGGERPKACFKQVFERD